MSQGLPSNRAELPSSCTAVSDGTVVKNLPVNVEDARDMGLTPGLERSPGVGNGNPLQYSSLENPMDREAWQATVHGAAKSQTRLRDFTSVIWESNDLKQNKTQEFTLCMSLKRFYVICINLSIISK